MLKIPASIHDDLGAHGRKGFPIEVCVILGNTGDTISAMYPMTNANAGNVESEPIEIINY